MGRAPVKSLAVVADQDRAAQSLADGQIDRASRARHQRDQRGLVALADDAQNPMPALEGHVLDIGAAGLTDPQTVQPEQHRQRGNSCGANGSIGWTTTSASCNDDQDNHSSDHKEHHDDDPARFGDVRTRRPHRHDATEV
jgi:hypothetical protein